MLLVSSALNLNSWQYKSYCMSLWKSKWRVISRSNLPSTLVKGDGSFDAFYRRSISAAFKRSNPLSDMLRSVFRRWWRVFSFSLSNRMADEISSPNYDKLAVAAAHTISRGERVACNCMHFLVIVIKGEWICSRPCW
jgi:hypothetical protein